MSHGKEKVEELVVEGRGGCSGYYYSGDNQVRKGRLILKLSQKQKWNLVLWHLNRPKPVFDIQLRPNCLAITAYDESKSLYDNLTRNDRICLEHARNMKIHFDLNNVDRDRENLQMMAETLKQFMDQSEKMYSTVEHIPLAKNYSSRNHVVKKEPKFSENFDFQNLPKGSEVNGDKLNGPVTKPIERNTVLSGGNRAAVIDPVQAIIAEKILKESPKKVSPNVETKKRSFGETFAPSPSVLTSNDDKMPSKIDSKIASSESSKSFRVLYAESLYKGVITKPENNVKKTATEKLVSPQKHIRSPLTNSPTTNNNNTEVITTPRRLNFVDVKNKSANSMSSSPIEGRRCFSTMRSFLHSNGHPKSDPPRTVRRSLTSEECRNSNQRSILSNKRVLEDDDRAANIKRRASDEELQALEDFDDLALKTSPTVSFYGRTSGENSFRTNSGVKRPMSIDGDGSNGRAMVRRSGYSLHNKENDEYSSTSNGFKNFGATCYMNSVLQSLFGLEFFMLGLRDLYDSQESLQMEDGVLMQLLDLHNYHLKPSEDRVKVGSLERFRKKVALAADDFHFANEMEDAHEYYIRLLSVLEEECSHLNGNGNIIRDNTTMTVKSTIKCLRCSKVTRIAGEQFNCLSLNMPSHEGGGGSSRSLQHLVDAYFHEGSMDHTCTDCSHEQSERHNEISILPPILVLHLKRYRYEDKGAVKNDDPVSIPVQLDLRRHCLEDVIVPLDNTETTQQDESFTSVTSDDDEIFIPVPTSAEEEDQQVQKALNQSLNDVEKKFDYELRAVIQHRGVHVSSGHYIAMVKHTKRGAWFECDDTSVTMIHERDVLDAGEDYGYVFFYTRRSTENCEAQSTNS